MAKTGRPQFGLVTVWGCEQFRFFGSGGSSAKKVFFFLVFQRSFTGKDSTGSGFGSWRTVPAVLVNSVSGKKGSNGSGFRFRFLVPVSGSGFWFRFGS